MEGWVYLANQVCKVQEEKLVESVLRVLQDDLELLDTLVRKALSGIKEETDLKDLSDLPDIRYLADDSNLKDTNTRILADFNL